MTQRVNVPGVGDLEFPDGMSDADMAAAIKKNYPDIHKPSKEGPRSGTRGQSLGSVASDSLGFITGNINKGIASALGAPVDTSANVIDLAKAITGYTTSKISGKPPPEWADPMNRGQTPFSGEWNQRMLRSAGMITPQADTESGPGRIVAAGLQGAGAGMVPMGSGGGLPGVARNVGSGAVSGAAAGAAGEAGLGVPGQAIASILPSVPGAFRPTPSPQARLMHDKGVSLTPGQISGGGIGKIEEGLAGIPLIGDIPASARSRGVRTFNEAAINEALAPIGEKLPKGTSGHEAIAYARSKLGDAYDRLTPQMSGQVDQQFMTDTNAISQSMRTLPANDQQLVRSIIQKEIGGRFQNGQATGEQLKDMQSSLRIERERLNSTKDGYMLAPFVRQAEDAVREMIRRQNPALKAELDKIDKGYASFKVVQRAAGQVGTQEGVFTPSMLKSASKAKDTTKDKRATSEGEGRLQQFAEAGQATVSNKLGDSGTATRGLIEAILGGGAGLHFLNPATAAAALAVPALYSPMGGRAYQNWAMGQGGPSQNTGRNLYMATQLQAPPRQEDQ